MKMQIAILQFGFGVLGIGDSLREAVADAEQYGAEFEESIEDLAVANIRAGPIHGKCYSLPITAEAAESCHKHGGADAPIDVVDGIIIRVID